MRVAVLKYTMLKGWSFITCKGGEGVCVCVGGGVLQPF